MTELDLKTVYEVELNVTYEYVRDSRPIVCQFCDRVTVFNCHNATEAISAALDSIGDRMGIYDVKSGSIVERKVLGKALAAVYPATTISVGTARLLPDSKGRAICV